MKISVDRQLDGKDLVFTIRCSDPQVIPFDLQAVEHFQEAARSYEKFCQENDIYHDTENELIKDAILQLFDKYKDLLEKDIYRQFRPRFTHICQEIYNWQYDMQEGDLKKWMTAYDPVRTKYYFDNDQEQGDDFEEDDSQDLV